MYVPALLMFHNTGSVTGGKAPTVAGLAEDGNGCEGGTRTG
jgi:hypothetical protein